MYYFGYKIEHNTIILILLMGAASVFFVCIIAVLLIAIIANKTLRISLKEKLHLLFKEPNILKYECLKLFNSLNFSGGFLYLCAARDFAAESSKAAGGGFRVTSAAPADQHPD